MRFSQKVRNRIVAIDFILLLSIYLSIKLDVGGEQPFYILYALTPILAPLVWAIITSFVILGLPILLKRTLLSWKKIFEQNTPPGKKLLGGLEVIVIWSLVVVAVLEVSKIFL